MTKYRIILLFLTLILISCESFLEEDPRSFIATSNFYETDEQAISGINAAYGNLRQEGVRLEFIYIDDVSADDLIPNAGQPADRIEMDLQVYTSEHAYLSMLWTNQYRGINRANTVLANLGDNISTDLAKRLEAEAKFLRAFYHFRLVRWFGDVPLLTSETNSADESVLFPSRTPSVEVYEQIVEDLQFAEENLDDRYNYGDPDYYRATKGAAKSLLAKVYLTMAGYPINDQSKWALARDKAREVIENRATYGYERLNNIADIFDVELEAANTEQIWSLPGDAGLSTNGWYFTRMRRYFITWNTTLVTKEVIGHDSTIVSIWGDELNDLRRKTAIGRMLDGVPTDVDGVTGDVRCIKYWDGMEDAFARNDFHYLRFSEVYYMLAEAIVETDGNLDEAMEIINWFRTRAGVTPLTYTDKNNVRQIIRKEKRKEFLFEGKRRPDLIRWGIYVDTMIAHGEKQFGPGADNQLSHTAERNTLFPLPLKEVIANENLTPQNFDY